MLCGYLTVVGLVQGMDDTEVAAMGYAELNEGISPTSALEVCAQPAATSQRPRTEVPCNRLSIQGFLGACARASSP